MKRVLVIMISLSLCVSAFAQRKGGYYHAYHPRVVVVPSFSYGVGFGYPLYGYPFYASPYAFPYYGYPYAYGYQRTPSKLALQVQSINLDYKNRIQTVRHNKSLSRSERRAEIRNLKTERAQAVIQAQQDFLNHRTNTPNQKDSPTGTNSTNGNSGGDAAAATGS